MSGWSGGYVTDIEYIRSFHGDQAPSLLDLVCLLTGNAPPERSGKVSYCDLGCGPGYTAALLAAANPDIDFWGIDFNPVHIAEGRAFQSEIGLTNLDLCERAFADLVGSPTHDLPQFDYIALHGVYSWIGPDDRRAIVRFLASHVKPGGLVYIGYNALPRWTAELPIQRILATHSRFSRERSDRAVEQAIAFVKRMRDAGAVDLDRPPVVEKLDRMLAEGRQRYLAHEYLNEYWTPMYHEDIARDLAAAKLEYVGVTALLENFTQLSLTPAQLALCQELGGPAVFETLKDFFLGRSFRGDIFVRGRRRLSASQQATRLRALTLDLCIPASTPRLEFAAPAGKSQLNEAVYRPIFEALGRGSATVGSLLDLPEVKPTSASPVEVVGMLVGTNQAIPRIQDAAETTRRTALSFNATVVRRAIEEGEASIALVAPSTGSGIILNTMETQIYAQLASGTEANTEAIAGAIARDFARRGARLSAAGRPIDGAEETLAALREEIAPLLADRLPLWRRFGAI